MPVLSWQAPTSFAVAHYDIYRDGVLLASTTTAATSYTDGTAPEGVHDYAVLARGADASAGVLSASFKVTYDLTPPTSGGAPTADVQTNGSVNLVWPAAADALSGVAGYVVRRAAGATPPASASPVSRSALRRLPPASTPGPRPAPPRTASSPATEPATSRSSAPSAAS